MLSFAAVHPTHPEGGTHHPIAVTSPRQIRPLSTADRAGIRTVATSPQVARDWEAGRTHDFKPIARAGRHVVPARPGVPVRITRPGLAVRRARRCDGYRAPGTGRAVAGLVGRRHRVRGWRAGHARPGYPGRRRHLLRRDGVRLLRPAPAA